MISNDKAFDMLPFAIDIFDKLEIEKYIAKNKKKVTDGANQTAEGVKLIKYILKNANKVKGEVFEIVAIVEDKKAEEVKKDSIFTTIKSLKEILETEGMLDFFKSAMG